MFTKRYCTITFRLRTKRKKTVKNELDEKIKQNIVENYDRYYRLAYSYVRNEHDALDIVQEGSYKAIYYGKTLKNEQFLTTWVYRIMINEALSYIKKNHKDYDLIEEVAGGKEDIYEEVDLKRAIDNLGEPESTIIRLRFFEDLKIEKVAEILNENVNTVKTKLYRSLKKLKLELSEEELHD